MSKHPASERAAQPDDERAYTFDFAPLSEGGSAVHLTGWPDPSVSREFGASLNDADLGDLALAPVFPPVVADLLDLATAIYAADWLAPYHLHRGYRRLHIRLPLRCPTASEKAAGLLSELLDATTGSNWSFEFVLRSGPSRPAEQKAGLPFEAVPVDVALWSGGLDALAGLATRARQELGKRFVLVGVGGSDVVLGRQREVYNRLGPDLQRRASLACLPIHLSGISGLRKNKLSRARGVVYAMTGAAAAVLFGEDQLSVYENGVGALNLPYTRAEVGLDHSRSVHPLTLRLVSQVVTAVLDRPFTVHNPFLYTTKAAMVAGLTGDGLHSLIARASSCDSPHRSDPFQCGYCSSCVLRRQSLAAAGLDDPTRYVVPHEVPPKGDALAYARLASAQAERLGVLASEGPSAAARWEALARAHPVLDDIVDRCASDQGLVPEDMRSRFLDLFSRHADEWPAARPILAQNGLPVSTDRVPVPA